MKTQISRLLQEQKKRYSAVYQQQGRMLTDADWNTLSNLIQKRLESALEDVIGSGIPRQQTRKSADSALDVDWVEGALKIKPGKVYVEGVPGEIPNMDNEEGVWLSYNEQPDFSDAPNFPSEGTQHVYLDVWHRTVTSLEDNDLMDAALHGADTTTRAKTMVQVKFGDNEEEIRCLPKTGSAKVAIQLAAGTAAEDPCDPCAAQVDVEERVGNYLFRLEVHNVTTFTHGDGSLLKRIQWKWSRENGAEQYLQGDAQPLGFTEGNWIYEFFNAETETNLGLHLAPSFNPKRGRFSDEIESPPGMDYLGIRRWDGVFTLQQTPDGGAGTGWEIYTEDLATYNQDMGVPLTVGNEAALNNHGSVYIEDNTVRVALDTVQLWLLLDDDPDFVPGDFWTAPVRERENEQGDFVLGTRDIPEPDPDADPDAEPPPLPLPEGECPQGIEHHYVRLYQITDVDGTRGRLEYEDSPYKLEAFPPLSDIWASDVKFTNCENDSTIFQTNPTPPGEEEDEDVEPTFATNVQEALSALCNLMAENVGFEACENKSIFQTNVGEGGDPEYADNVQDALHALCALQAVNVEFDPCTNKSIFQTNVGELGDPEYAQDVQAALHALCALQAMNVEFDPCTNKSIFQTNVGSGGDPEYAQDVQAALHALCALQAVNVEFDPCTDKPIYQTGVNADGEPEFAQDVQAALQALCDLDAGKIPFTSGCPELQPYLDGTVRKSVDALLSQFTQWPTTPDGSPLSVQHALQMLFCILNAKHIPVNRDGLCEYLQNYENGDERVESVQDALNALCEREPTVTGGGGCAKTVGLGGDFENLEQALLDIPSGDPVWLCLMPGENIITQNFDEKSWPSVKITGSGVPTSIVRIYAPNFTLQSEEIILQDISFQLIDPTSTIVLKGISVKSDRCSYLRETTIDTSPSLVIIENFTDFSTVLDWENNMMKAFWELPRDPEAFTTEDTRILDEFKNIKVGRSTLNRLFRDWWATDRSIDPDRYKSIKRIIIQTIKGIPKAERDAIVTATGISALASFGNRSIRSRRTSLSRRRLLANSPRFASSLFSNPSLTIEGPRKTGRVADLALLFPEPSIPEDLLNDTLDALYDDSIPVEYKTCLALASNEVGGWIRCNNFRGNLELYRGREAPPNSTKIPRDVYERSGYELSGSGPREVGGGEDLTLAHNRLYKVVSYTEPLTNDELQVAEAFAAHANFTITGNTFYGAKSSVMAATLTLSDNHFRFPITGDFLLFGVAERGLLTGNDSDSYQQALKMWSTFKEFVANILSVQ